MSEIPTWWLVVTGIAGICLMLFFGAMCFLLVIVSKQVAGLNEKVNDLIPQVKSLVEKVNEIASSTKSTVDNVGGHAKGIATSVDQISTIFAQRFEQFAPILGLLFTGAKVLKLIREVRGEKQRVKVKNPGPNDEMVIDLGEHVKDGKNAKRGKMTVRRGVEQSGSSSGS